MSFDLYLLPARMVGLDADRARAYVDREDARTAKTSDEPTHGESRKRELADLLLRLMPSYTEFHLDFTAIANFEKSTIEEAQRKYRYIEINGPSKPAGAQFLFHDNYIVSHWYSGTSPAEMESILYSLSLEGNFVVFDPQGNQVHDLRDEPL
jgi:hypothetical protein